MAVEYTLDASAVLALIQNEEGAAKVAQFLPRAVISAVNLAEVITKLTRKTHDPESVVRKLGMLGLQVSPWDEQSANYSARYASLAAMGLSLGDRACITHGMLSGAKIVTGDRLWKDIEDVGSQVILIR